MSPAGQPTARDRLSAAFHGLPGGRPAVCLHTWGAYPFEVQGRGDLWGRSRGEALARVYQDFLRDFPCDWLHVCEATFTPPSTGPLGYGHTGEASPAILDDIEGWLASNGDGMTLSKEEILRRGAYTHVGCLREAVAGQVMIVPNQEAPATVIPTLGWERQMALVAERPAAVARFAAADCARFLSHVEAAQAAGADGFIFSEGYGGALDLVAPDLYERLFLPAKTRFYAAVRSRGLLAIGYFLGNVMPYLDLINRIRPDGVMVEEGKKGFTLDVTEIRKRLDPDIVLFGNLDSCRLLHGDPASIRNDVRRQARALEHGRFVFANGSPLCPHTPPAHIHAFLEAARRCGI